MKAMRKLGALALLAGLATALMPVTDATAKAKGTKARCKTAWAILTPGTSDFQAAVRGIVAEHRKLNEDGYQEGVIERLDLKIFDLVGRSGDAVVAHCGHGGTCNILAHTVARKFPRLNPVVVCMQEPPVIVKNGRPM
jgi:hypothetical protein